jgi:hypothetical protein
MTRPSNQQQRLLAAFRAAYHERDQQRVKVSQQWHTDVMRDIRRIGPLNAPGLMVQLLERMAWRFAMAACTAVLVLAIYTGFTGWNPVTEIKTAFLDDPVEFTVAQAFGAYDTYE